MTNIIVRRYSAATRGWKAWIEPDDRKWILFIDDEDQPHFFGSRDPDSGAVIDSYVV